jgi:predicted DNA-binding protein (UPF0251 family)
MIRFYLQEAGFQTSGTEKHSGSLAGQVDQVRVQERSMQVRFRIFEHLMRSMLESQAAMMASMAQLQQAVLSKMMHTPAETGAEARQQEIKTEEAGSKTDQPATTSTKGQTVQKRAPAPRRRQSNQTKPRPTWFEGRGDSHHLSSEGVKHLRSLFDQGLSQSEAARRMGITPAAVRRRFQAWSGKQAA